MAGREIRQITNRGGYARFLLVGGDDGNPISVRFEDTMTRRLPRLDNHPDMLTISAEIDR
jgi:hypothetical protein